MVLIAHKATRNAYLVCRNTPHWSGPVAANGPVRFFLYTWASCFFSGSDLSVAVFSTRMTIPSVVTWSCRFLPTGRFLATAMSIFCRYRLGPTPDSISNLGEFSEPALTITSLRTYTVRIRFLCRNSTPYACFLSISTRVTCASVSTVRFFRFFRTGRTNALFVLIRSPCLAVDCRCVTPICVFAFTSTYGNPNSSHAWKPHNSCLVQVRSSRASLLDVRKFFKNVCVYSRVATADSKRRFCVDNILWTLSGKQPKRVNRSKPNLQDHQSVSLLSLGYTPHNVFYEI